MIKAQFGLIIVIAFSSCAIAQEVKNEIWPELNIYYKRHNVNFIRFAAGLTKSDPVNQASDGFLELDVQFGLKRRIIEKIVEDPDFQKTHLVTMRGGYAYVPSFADENASIEHRGIFEVTSRYPIFGSVLLSDRNRLDFRWINRKYSTRYRNRFRIEHEFEIKKFHFTPYGSAEFYYDTRVHGWNRNEYLFGTEFPFRKRYVIEFYFSRQNNRGTEAVDINAMGWVFQMYLGK